MAFEAEWESKYGVQVEVWKNVGRAERVEDVSTWRDKEKRRGRPYQGDARSHEAVSNALHIPIQATVNLLQ